jgi:8-oxo-dGTP pyrophosphatase MutT (NUDIX family)
MGRQARRSELLSSHPAADLLLLLDHYASRRPEEVDAAGAFAAFARSGFDVFERTRVDGHFTASCWLVSGDGARVLLTHHRKLDRWLQLGGHADGDPDLAQVALREAREESGLIDLVIVPEIFDIDAHLIPARGTDPAHTHWDVRFVVRCTGAEDFVVSTESLALAWVPIVELLQDRSVDPSLRRMATKWEQQRR